MEIHQRWQEVRHENGRAELSVADERALRRGDVATLIPPDDVHNHGHVTGSGPIPYSLILLGDDMLVFEREEYDAEQRTWHRLAPGDRAGPTADLSRFERFRAAPAHPRGTPHHQDPVGVPPERRLSGMAVLVKRLRDKGLQVGGVAK